MGLNIKNPATEAAIRELATARGIGLTEAVDQAVREALGNTVYARTRDKTARRRSVEEIVEHFNSLPTLDPRPSWVIADELYDENGLPV